MNWIIYIFGSGYAFFLGIGLILVCLTWSSRFSSSKNHRLVSLVAIAGALLVGLSAAPLPGWLYVVMAIAFTVWLVTERISDRPQKKALWRWTAGLLCLVAVILEARYQRLPSIPATNERVIYLLGDSIAAGVSSHETGRWPQGLASLSNLEVVDLSHMGATVSTANREAEKIPATGGIVLLEIGGNDLLGTTPVDQFERDLEDLLTHVCQKDRIVLMFELPLPPMYNEWGRIQRRLANRYSVNLIPKRILASVISGSGATLDSVHLSPDGHRQMANTVWKILEPAFE